MKIQILNVEFFHEIHEHINVIIPIAHHIFLLTTFTKMRE